MRLFHKSYLQRVSSSYSVIFFLRENDGSASASRNEVALTPLGSLTPSMDTRELSIDTERDFGTFD